MLTINIVIEACCVTDAENKINQVAESVSSGYLSGENFDVVGQPEKEGHECEEN